MIAWAARMLNALLKVKSSKEKKRVDENEKKTNQYEKWASIPKLPFTFGLSLKFQQNAEEMATWRVSAAFCFVYVCVCVLLNHLIDNRQKFHLNKCIVRIWPLAMKETNKQKPKIKRNTSHADSLIFHWK